MRFWCSRSPQAFEEHKRQLEQQAKEAALFKARPYEQAARKAVWRPKKSEATLCAPQPFRFSSDTRAQQRREFDAKQVARMKAAEEAKRLKLLEQQSIADEEEKVRSALPGRARIAGRASAALEHTRAVGLAYRHVVYTRSVGLWFIAWQEFRRQSVFKAQPVRYNDMPQAVGRVEAKALTSPKTPHFHTKARAARQQ